MEVHYKLGFLILFYFVIGIAAVLYWDVVNGCAVEMVCDAEAHPDGCVVEASGVVVFNTTYDWVCVKPTLALMGDGW